MSESACIFCRGREGDSLNHHLIATRYDLERAIAERDEARAEVESLRAELARLRAWATGERPGEGP